MVQRPHQPPLVSCCVAQELHRPAGPPARATVEPRPPQAEQHAAGEILGGGIAQRRRRLPAAGQVRPQPLARDGGGRGHDRARGACPAGRPGTRPSRRRGFAGPSSHARPWSRDCAPGLTEGQAASGGAPPGSSVRASAGQHDPRVVAVGHGRVGSLEGPAAARWQSHSQSTARSTTGERRRRAGFQQGAGEERGRPDVASRRWEQRSCPARLAFSVRDRAGCARKRQPTPRRRDRPRARPARTGRPAPATRGRCRRTASCRPVPEALEVARRRRASSAAASSARAARRQLAQRHRHASAGLTGQRTAAGAQVLQHRVGRQSA